MANPTGGLRRGCIIGTTVTEQMVFVLRKLLWQVEHNGKTDASSPADSTDMIVIGLSRTVTLDGAAGEGKLLLRSGSAPKFIRPGDVDECQAEDGTDPTTELPFAPGTQWGKLRLIAIAGTPSFNLFPITYGDI